MKTFKLSVKIVAAHPVSEEMVRATTVGVQQMSKPTPQQVVDAAEIILEQLNGQSGYEWSREEYSVSYDPDFLSMLCNITNNGANYRSEDVAIDMKFETAKHGDGVRLSSHKYMRPWARDKVAEVCEGYQAEPSSRSNPPGDE